MPSALRRPLYRNDSAKKWHTPSATTDKDSLSSFHRRLPSYSPTRLVPLQEIADEIGVKAVYLKDEGMRLGLPSFKILGASWGTFKAVVNKYGFPLDSDLPTLKMALSSHPTTLLAATEGNHGRAVARMGSLLGVQTQIFVSKEMHSATVQAIRNEGAIVTQIDGPYDLAVKIAYDASLKCNGILVQDTAFPGYEDIPAWIVQGYGTMMHEIDEQLGDQVPDLVIGPVGAGSFMQAVVSHYKAPGRNSRVLAVEADTAASLYKSLTKGELVTVETTPTIMAGLNCGIISGIAWPLLQAGVDASLTISDYEAHQAVELLKSLGVSAGACGAASLGALRRLATSDKAALCLNDSSVIVLLCTESAKEYNIPKNVSVDDAQSLTQNLVQIGSAIPGTGYVAGPGETEIARYITAWLQHRDIETRWLEPTRGRPSVIGMVRGTGQGKSLMLNGHIDTVTTASYDGDPLSGQIKNGRLYGRGSADMKGGIAAILIALAQAKEHPLHGDLIFTGVADEEDLSLGTEQLLEAGWRADGAIICEPTQEDLVIANKGFVWFEVVIHGLAAHGSRFDLGIDAISRAGYFLVELDKYSQNLIAGPKISTLGPGSVHASIIKGGEEPASYPASCTIKLERRIVAGESVDQVKSEIENVLQAAARGCPGLSYDLKVTFSRPPFEIAKDDQFVSLVADQIKVESGKEAEFAALSAWCDAALLADKGIPVVIYGPKGEGLHAKEEWVDIQSIDNVASTLIGISRVFCGHIEE